MTISAVVVSHGQKDELTAFLSHLSEQTRQPDELIVIACCVGLHDVQADVLVRDRHRDDWGQHKRDIGIRLATMDYVALFNSDDDYDTTYLEKLSQHDADLIYCDFHSHLTKGVILARPEVGCITTGNFLVKTSLAQSVGYNHRDYEGDGKFVRDIMSAGATTAHIPEVLYSHR